MKKTGARILRFQILLITAAASTAALTLASAPLTAQAGIAEREGRSMRIGIIGSGTMGGPLGQL